MGVVIALAHSFPNVARSGGIIRSEYSISYGAVALIFLISGFSMPTKTLIKQAGNFRAHIVTQALSFLVTPAIMFGFAQAMRVGLGNKIDPYVTVGFIFAGCTPTTVSSNVVMTKKANGNDSLSLIEVTIGNILGAFISPALIQMFLSKNAGFSYGNPVNDSSVTELYARVMKQLGLSLFVPLFVGQVCQNLFPKFISWLMKTFKLAKIGTFCLLLLIWATFSTGFYQDAFEEVSTETMILVCFFNIAVYLLFTVICFLVARNPLIPKIFKNPAKAEANDILDDIEHTKQLTFSSKLYSLCMWFFRPFYFDRKDTVAIMLCGAAKTVALGVPLITAQYGAGNSLIGRVSIPLTLYQGEQILTAQLLIPLFKWWIGKELLEDISDDEKKSFEVEDASENIGTGLDETQKAVREYFGAQDILRRNDLYYKFDYHFNHNKACKYFIA
ncbi:hypothetical protein NADFUDRAFT_50220 [Nadsonia fulvescens var. elongata DSM 6958]|uniref:Uncharacterized protein n=1 Tax=Nadsonia fulvescens var. elongata DSM 6958 TaxID=857566 RepID=A0A1E3PLI4_9ASCO|nr:hypothetical protein NADFUDRAFT_50220 [Nadsonia fulvescens var. elongata DSM 6958]